MKCLKYHAQRLATGLLLGICALNVHFAHAATDCNAVTEIPVSECQSLLELYNSTNGASWKNNTDWNQTNTPCSWFGITCSGGYVQKISLSDDGNNSDSIYGNNLVGTIPNLNLPNLTILNISLNQLSGSIPDFTQLPNLTKLSLVLNQLSGSIPNFNLPNLTFLSLGANRLSGSIPNFTNLPNLQTLSLSSNQLSESIPNFNFPNLTSLDLSSNQLSGIIPNFTSFNLVNLQYAHFYNNCGLTAYDAAQETVLNAKDSRWKERNPNCGVVSQCATFTPPAVNIPCVNVGGTVYKAGMNLISNTPTMRFEVGMSNLQPSNLIPTEQCAVFPAPNTLDHLRINCLDLGDKYWVDLKLVDNSNPIQFDLVKFDSLLSGIYSGTKTYTAGREQGTTYNISLTLLEASSILKGIYTLKDNNSNFDSNLSGTKEGNAITLTADIPSCAHIFVGTINGNTMSGTMTTENNCNGSGSWSVSK